MEAYEKEDVTMKRRVLASILTLLLLLSLTACGGAKMEAPARTEEAAKSEPMAEAPAAGEMNYGSDMMYDAVMEESKSEAGGATVPQEQKLIITARMELETTEFEPAVQGLNDLVAEFGGYFENSSIANRKSGSRWADYTVRVPATRYELFMNQVGELCHETWREASAQNITEAYYDTQGRLKTQQIKLERLQELLSKAELMEDIITIESAISETEWNIDNLSGTLRRYDAKVDYATVNVNLNEVYKLSNVETVPETFGQRLGRAFGNGMKNFVNNVEDLVVSFAYNWIGILIWIGVIAVAVTVVRKRVRRSRLHLPKLGRKSAPVEKNDDKQDEI
jgi:hypothetical protein